MKSSKESETSRPFKNLKGFLKEKQFTLSSGQKEDSEAQVTAELAVEVDDEDVLFETAMAGVEPIE
ncbi:MAG: hypothetical protein JRI47_04930, partial [Deltaproteobacteria bacterium]|nr:hypothetical protein [Deltaproteobacteria bacterium]